MLNSAELNKPGLLKEMQSGAEIVIATLS